MTPRPEVAAAAAIDAYSDRSQSDVDKPTKVFLHEHSYFIFGYKTDPAAGFQATAYLSVDAPHNVIVAYRGTELSRKDASTDFRMVRDRVNLQKPDADAFTKEMIRKAEAHGVSRDRITLAGHSLGGTLVEIEAWEVKLHGLTLNAYGAVDLDYGIPEGGTLVTGYVMAGDVVSAASRHFGRQIPLASAADIVSLIDGRYINAAPGTQRNPLLAMRISDHSGEHFSPAPGSQQISVLDPEMMARYARNYAEHKDAIDRYRKDVYTERAEVAVALRHANDLDLPAIWSGLPPKVQQQLAEYHAAILDKYVRSPVERNALFTNIEQGLEHTSANLRGTGQEVQSSVDQFAHGAVEAGLHAQQRTDDLAQGLQRIPLDPITKIETIASANAAGYGIRAETEGIAETSQLAGRTLHAAMRFAATEAEAARDAIKQTAHLSGNVATGLAHEVEGKVVAASHAYYEAQTIAEQLIETGENARRALAQSVDAAERGARRTYEIAAHPSEWFGHEEAKESMPQQPFSAPAHPQNAMYSALEKLFPQGTSEARLSQATAACCKAGISNPKDIERIYVTEKAAVFMFRPMWATTAQIDLSHPAPSVADTLQQLHQYNEEQAQLQPRFAAQVEAHVQSGPVR
jgi:hypothetical protein